MFFICNSLILSEIPLVYYIYLLFHFNTLFSSCYFLFGTPKHPRLSASGDCGFFSLFCCNCAFSVYCVIFFISIYIKNICRRSVVQIYESYSLVSLSSLVYEDQLIKHSVITLACRFQIRQQHFFVAYLVNFHGNTFIRKIRDFC